MMMSIVRDVAGFIVLLGLLAANICFLAGV